LKLKKLIKKKTLFKKMCHHCKSSKCHSDKKHEGGCSSKGIDQCHFNKSQGTYVICKPGNYHLKKDVRGTISIQSSNVCLDLCCHTLDANGADNAIVIGEPLVEQATLSAKKQSVESLRSEISSFKKKSIGEASEKPRQKVAKKTTLKARDVKSKSEPVGSIHHVRISNGTVCGAADAAILSNSVFDLEVSDLTMLNNALDSVRVLRSNVVTVKNVEFSGLESGERALLVNFSDNLTVSDCSASGYLTTIGAILEFNTSNTIDMSNVSVTNNVKSAVQGNVIWDSSTALVFFGGFGIVNYDPYVGCSGVKLDNVRVNHNIIYNIYDSCSVCWQTFEAIFLGYCNNCSINNCETSNNADIAGSVGADIDTEDFMLNLMFCDSCTITNHKSNNNTSAPVYYFSPVAVYDSANIVLDGCQANSNVVEGFAEGLGFDSLYTMYSLPPYFGDANHNTTIRNSQANNNLLISGRAGRTVWNGDAGFLFAFQVGGDESIVDNCEASNNGIGDNLPYTAVIGILQDFAQNARISNCVANVNYGGELAHGINVIHTGFADNTVISNCVANDNGTYGISVGDVGFDRAINNIVIENCNCIGNGVEGISLGTLDGSVGDVLVQNCKVVNTGGLFSAGALRGIVAKYPENLVIKDCDVISAPTNAEVTINTEVPQSFPAVFTNSGPRDSYPITGPGKIAGSAAEPTNACDDPLTDLTGNVAIVIRADSNCFSGVIADNTEAAGAVATVILDSLDSLNYGGNATQPAVVIPISLVEDFLAAWEAAPEGTTLTVGFSSLAATGVYILGGNNCKILNTEVLNQPNNGIELDSETTNSLVQDCHALGNGDVGFLDNTAFANAWLGNKAQNNTGGAYSGVAAANISTYDKSTGLYTSTPYATTNLDIV